MTKSNKGNIYPPQIAFEQLAAALSGYSQPLRSIAIIGTSEGVGATTVAVNLAQTLAAANQNILLVSVRKDAGPGKGASITNAAAIVAAVEKSAGNFSHAVITAARFPQIVPGNSALFNRLGEGLLEKYDLVIWDVLPVDSSPLSGVLCKYAQGVVLVIHAGKTRWHSARHTVNSLRFSGAHVLGVVLNKKKMYIPRWLYRFLFRYAA